MQSSNRGPNQQELEEFFAQAGNNVLRMLFGRGTLLLILALVVLVIIWLGSGVYVVQPGEEGVVRTLGRFSGVTVAGLNFHIPYPFQTVDIVDVESIRRVEIGFRTTESDTKRPDLSEALMLTMDENIVQVELLIQYRIANSRDFVFNVKEAEQVLRTSTEVALRSTVGQMTIDDVITEQRAQVQEQTRVFLTQLLSDYGAGILVTGVRLQVADPPQEIRDAFQEVVRAKADKERLINEAQAYQNDVVPRARGVKQQVIEEAGAFKEQQVLRATGDAERFAAVLAAYQLAPGVTRERMYIEALEGILGNVRLVLLDKNAVGGQVLPFLPLTDLNANPGVAAVDVTGRTMVPAVELPAQPEVSSQTEGAN